MSSYPTLDAHRERLQEQLYAHWPPEVLRVRLSALANTHPYHIDTNAMMATRINAHMHIKNHLWIELSTPVRSELLAGIRVPTFDVSGQQVDHRWHDSTPDITAMFYYWRALETARCNISYPAIGRYDLELLLFNGMACGTISYYSTVKRWAIPCFNRCEQCNHQDHSGVDCNVLQEPCTVECSRCESYLNTWRTRFRQALTIIQHMKHVSVADMSI